MPARRSPEAMEKDYRAYDLFRRGLSYRQIAAELGWKSGKSAFEAVRRGAKEAARDALKDGEAQQAALDRLQDYRRAMQRILAARHYQTTQGGKLITDPDGKPMTDTGPWVSAMAQLRWIEQEDNRLRDLYPALKSRVEIIPEETIDAECARLIQEIAEREASAAAADPSTA